MKKIIAVILLLTAVSFPVNAEKWVFTEFGLSYGTITSPQSRGIGSYGVFDTPVFDAKAGVSIYKWGEIYLGGAYNVFIARQDSNSCAVFAPLYIGARANIFPLWPVFPDVFFETGMSLGSMHMLVLNPSPGYRDISWNGGYYNFGVGVNLNVADIAVLRLSLERPAFYDVDEKEIHIIKTGLAWKIFY
ncbi:MAG: hypothetical protein JXR81_03085 [Candidatus Goldbacteria bacterium]|nr:hypothetical protein [Candidatus Goldiibacteriota bacterium]